MIEMNALTMTTDDKDWQVLKDLLLERVDRCMGPARQELEGEHTLRRDISRGGLIALAYAQLVMGHANVIRGCVRGEEYSSACALLRPMLEALLKQWLTSEESRNTAVNQMVKHRQKVCKASLVRLRQAGGPDVVDLWEQNESILNDFVHGGLGLITYQKSGYTYDQIFPAQLVWQSCTFVALATTAAAAQALHMYGYYHRAHRISEHVRREGDWSVVEGMRNGTPLRATK